MANVLIIDDEEAMCRMLAELVSKHSHHADYTLTLKEGIKRAMSGSFDVVFLDVNLPDGSGLDAIEKIRNISQHPEIIIITGAGDPDGAEIAIENGAWDYIQKPLSLEKIILLLKRVLQYRDNFKQAHKPPVLLKREGIVGSSREINESIQNLADAANSNANALITGETGTGKELFAKAIHNNSSRSSESFVVVDCAALPETLVESTLFGYTKGAFTGADRPHDGLIKIADGGTLFLDEVGELSLELQKAFLRVLQDGNYRPVGSRHELESDFRIVSATNKNLDQRVQSGHFRKDLLYRLRAITIDLPSLKERSKDITELVVYYSKSISKQYKIKPKRFSPDFLDVLSSYEWPGNVRELVNTLESAISKSQDEPILFPIHLPTHIRVQAARAKVVTEKKLEDKVDHRIKYAEIASRPIGTLTTFRDFRLSILEEAEEKYFLNLMDSTEWNIKEACDISNLSRTRLYAVLRKHNISKHIESTIEQNPSSSI